MADDAYITGMTAAAALTGDELIEIAQLSPTVTITAATISAQASDNSYNDSGSGFVAAGFVEGDRVRVQGFTGDVANNLFVGVITALTTAKMTIGGTDGDVIVDDAAGESVTITKWVSRRVTIPGLGDAISIDDLSDVDVVGPADGEALVWDSSAGAWVNGTAEAGPVAFHGALVKKSTDQTAANFTTATAITWDTDVYDTDAIHDTGSNTSRLTVPSGVTKVVVKFCYFITSLTANEYIHAWIAKDGTDDYAGAPGSIIASPLTSARGTLVSPVLEVVAGNYFEAFLDGQTDTSVTLESERSWFAMEIIE